MSRHVHDTPRRRRRRRGPLRRLLETRGVVGGYAQRHLQARLTADDGTRLAATYLRGPSGAAPAVLLVHGFAAHRRKPAYACLAEGLAGHVNVLALDLRGHGESAGRCTLGDLEALDVVEGLRWLRRFGHPHVTVVGVSMGGTGVLHAAASGAARPDAVVAVSTPARMGVHDTGPMRRLRDAWHTPWKRAGMDLLLNVTVVRPGLWRAPPHPVDVAPTLDVPMLVVHGEDDDYFPIADAEELASAGGAATTLWRRPAGFGHAEDGLTAPFADRLGRAVTAAAHTGRFPGWDGAASVSTAAAPR